MHDRLGGRTMLCDPARGRIPADEHLEQMANDRVPDDQPMRRDPKREPVHDNIDWPQWCPAGLTRSQKRRVQRLHQIEILEEETKGDSQEKGVNQKFGVSSQELMIGKILIHRLRLLTWLSCCHRSKQSVFQMLSNGLVP